MIHIAICDDDPMTISRISDYLGEKARAIQQRLEIAAYRSGEAFLRDLQNGRAFHIVLMDIQMDGINGIEAGQILRGMPNGDDVIMIYISGHDGYYGEIANIGSFRFIKKPVDPRHLDDVMSRALTQAIKFQAALAVPALFRYKVSLDQLSVRTDRIVCFKSLQRRIQLYVWNSDRRDTEFKDSFYGKLSDIHAELPGDLFLHCERSHIVHMAYVGSMSEDAFILIDRNRTRIPISRGARREAKHAYFSYLEAAK